MENYFVQKENVHCLNIAKTDKWIYQMEKDSDTLENKAHGMLRRQSPWVSGIPTHLAGYGRMVRSWPFRFLSHFSVFFKQLAALTGEVTCLLWTKNRLLTACYKSSGFPSLVFLSCNKPTARSASIWATLSALMGLQGKRNWLRYADAHTVCCALWVTESLSLTQESYVFRYYPQNSNRLTY